MRFILAFDEIDKGALPLVGGKNASLGEMLRAGIRVPPGFAVTTEAYLAFIKEAGIQGTISRILSPVNPDNLASLDEASRRIRALIENTPLPPPIADEIQENYAALSARCGHDDVPAAVRSSATAEDSTTASFAGQQDTYLWVRGADAVADKVRRCWGSLFTPRAIAYRLRAGFPHERVLISVGVQKMVNAKAAGVLFTIDPVNGDPSKVVIEANWGLGETVASGTVTPDRYVVDKVLLEINQEVISTKMIECRYDPASGSLIHCEVSPDYRDKPCLTKEEVMELVQVARCIEQHYGCPQDIEWAIDSDIPFPENVFILQSRPETVWSQRKREPVLQGKTGLQLLFEQAFTPKRWRSEASVAIPA